MTFLNFNCKSDFLAMLWGLSPSKIENLRIPGANERSCQVEWGRNPVQELASWVDRRVDPISACTVDVKEDATCGCFGLSLRSTKTGGKIWLQNKNLFICPLPRTQRHIKIPYVNTKETKVSMSRHSLLRKENKL